MLLRKYGLTRQKTLLFPRIARLRADSQKHSFLASQPCIPGWVYIWHWTLKTWRTFLKAKDGWMLPLVGAKLHVRYFSKPPSRFRAGEYDHCAISVTIRDRPFSPLKKTESNDGLCRHAKLHWNRASIGFSWILRTERWAQKHCYLFWQTACSDGLSTGVATHKYLRALAQTALQTCFRPHFRGFQWRMKSHVTRRWVTYPRAAGACESGCRGSDCTAGLG